ncbi:MAG: nicotinamide riboside transporter PnuC [Proteiniphilum sp.]|nr:nicotinamide riboside transporter PnuC [Proteiniphilum sp.]
MQTIEIIGALIGLLYLYLEYHASRWLWPVGVLMPVVYVWIFFQSKFYADMGINVYYFFASTYGWIRWNKGRHEGGGPAISHTPRRLILPLSLVTTLLFASIYLILTRYTDSPVAAGDSLTTALSITGMWMLAQKHAEQWWVWVVVNFISCGLYLWKGLYPTAALFAIYSVISVTGYFKWVRLIKRA